MAINDPLLEIYEEIKKSKQKRVEFHPDLGRRVASPSSVSMPSSAPDMWKGTTPTQAAMPSTITPDAWKTSQPMQHKVPPVAPVAPQVPQAPPDMWETSHPMQQKVVEDLKALARPAIEPDILFTPKQKMQIEEVLKNENHPLRKHILKQAPSTWQEAFRGFKSGARLIVENTFLALNLGVTPEVLYGEKGILGKAPVEPYTIPEKISAGVGRILGSLPWFALPQVSVAKGIPLQPEGMLPLSKVTLAKLGPQTAAQAIGQAAKTGGGAVGTLASLEAIAQKMEPREAAKHIGLSTAAGALFAGGITAAKIGISRLPHTAAGKFVQREYLRTRGYSQLGEDLGFTEDRATGVWAKYDKSGKLANVVIEARTPENVRAIRAFDQLLRTYPDYAKGLGAAESAAGAAEKVRALMPVTAKPMIEAPAETPITSPPAIPLGPAPAAPVPKPQTPEEIRKSMQGFQITQQAERERQAAEKEMQEVEEAKRQEKERLEKSKGMEERVAELMEREGIPATLPEQSTPVPGVAPAGKPSEETLLPATQRIVNARNSFIESVMEQFGFSREETVTILEQYQKAKIVNLDPHSGQFQLKDGRFWEKGPMEEALKQAGVAPAEEIPAAGAEVPRERLEQSKGMEKRVKARPAEVAPAKEPWEMTLAEFAKTQKQDLNTIMNDIWGAWQKQKLTGQRGTELPYGIETAKQLYSKIKEDLLKDPGGARLIKVGHKEYIVADYEHKSVVQKALEAGKLVPEEVLKDYPELGAEVKPAEVKPEAKPAKLETETPTATKVKPEPETKAEPKPQTTVTEERPDLPIAALKDDIPYDLAYNAYRGISHTPDDRARQTQRDYVWQMEKTYKDLVPYAETDEQKALLKNELERYKEGLIKHLTAWLDAMSRTMSAMITGPAKFPTARNEKAMAVERKRLEELIAWEEKALNAIKRKLEGAETPEVKAGKEYARLEKEIRRTIGILKGIEDGTERGPDKNLFKSNLAGKIRRSIDAGNIEAGRKALDFLREHQKQLKGPAFTERHAIWTHADRAEKKQTEAEAKRSKDGVAAIAEYEGAKVVNNFDEKRTQIIFDGKPSEEVIRSLKSDGWRWAPSQSAWQRKLTPNAKASAKRIMEKHFEAAKAEAKNLPPLSTGKTVTAKTIRGTAIEAEYAIVEAGDLIASHDINLRENPDYPAELQPRDRTRMASEVQVDKIARELEPEWLGESPKVSDGAPIVGKDSIVESGNARVIALRRLYKHNHKNAELYKSWLADNTDKFGIDKEALESAKNPVLVRVRQTGVDRVKFTQEANERDTAAMSASELAQMDAQRLSGALLEMFVPSESGEIITAANSKFIAEFMGHVVGEADRGSYTTKSGSISQAGAMRIRNAIFAKAYGDTEAIEKLAESTDVNVKNQINAMLIAAPRIVRIRDAIRKGEMYDLDISAEVAAAMNILSSIRESGVTVERYLTQSSLMPDELSPLGKDILQVFDRHKRSAKKIAAILQAYMDAVEMAGDPRQVRLVKEDRKFTKDDALERAVRKVEGLDEEQVTLLQAQGMGGTRTGAPGERAFEEVKIEKTLPSTLKELGYRTREEAQMAFDAKDLGYSQWLLTFDEDKDIVFKYTGEVAPMEAYDKLTAPLKGLPPEDVNKRRLDLQLFAQGQGKEPDPVKDKARRRIFAIANKMGLDKEQRLSLARILLDRPDINSLKELTRNEIVELAEFLARHHRALKVSSPAERKERPGEKQAKKAQAKRAEKDMKAAEEEEKSLEDRIERSKELGYEVEMASDVYKLLGQKPPADFVDLPVGWIWDKQVFVPSPKEIAKWPEREIKKLTKEVNFYDMYLRPIYRVLPRELTDDGMKAKQVFTAFQDKYLKVINDATKGFTEQECIDTAAVLEGLLPKTGKEGRAADRIKKEFFDPLFKLAVEAGVLKEEQYVKEYFSRIGQNIKKISGETFKVPKRWFTHSRTGQMEDYNKNVKEVAHIYINAMSKAIHIDPFLQKWQPELAKMPQNKRRMAETFVTSLYGRPTSWEMMLNQLIKDMYQLLGKELPEGMRPSQDVGRAVISLLVQAYMGLNPGSAIKNMTQKMLAVADVSTGTKPLRGFKYLTRAQAFKATRAGKEFCNKYCTLLKDRTYMEGLEKTARYEWKINRMLDATSKVTMAAFQAADTSNVTDSFLIGLFAALEDGKSMEEALWQANDVALRTQFPYDLRKPLLFHNPVMRIVGLFASWPIHLVELGVDWVGSSRWGKIILLAALMAGAKYLMRKLGIHLRISLLDSLEGHIAFKTATGERAAIVSYSTELSRAARKMASLDKDEWLKAMEELAYLSPGGTAYKRLMRFYRASQDNWRLRNKKGKVYYQYDRSGWLWDNIGIPEEAIRALIGETTESHDYWKDVYPTLTDRVEGKRDAAMKGVIGQ